MIPIPPNWWTVFYYENYNFIQVQVGTDLPNIWTGAGMTTTVVVWLGVTTLAILVTTGVLTLGKSFREYRVDRKWADAKQRLLPEIRERENRTDPNWESWLAECSRLERDVARELLLEDLELLEGRNKRALQDLAVELNIDHEAHEYLRSEDHYRRLRGLGILTKLSVEVNPEDISSSIADDQFERDAAIHLLATQNHRRATDVGLELILQGDPMTVYGLEGLHKLIGSNPTPLLEYLAEESVANEKIRSQVLLVLEHAGIPAGNAPMDGVLEAAKHDNSLIRERACRVLGGYGWHPEVREALDVDALLTDPDVQVRIAAYWMVDEWGDKAARRKLAESTTRESDEHARVQIARALQRQRPQSLAELKAEGSFSHVDRSWADIRHVVDQKPNPLR